MKVLNQYLTSSDFFYLCLKQTENLTVFFFFFPRNSTENIWSVYFTGLFPSSSFYYCSATLADHGNSFQNVLKKACFVFENISHFFPGARGRQCGVKASLKTAHSSRKKWLSELSALHFTARIWRCCIGFDSIDTGLSQTSLVHCLAYSQTRPAWILIFNKILIGFFFFLLSKGSNKMVAQKNSPVKHILCLTCIIKNLRNQMTTWCLFQDGCPQVFNKKARLQNLAHSHEEKI